MSNFLFYISRIFVFFLVLVSIISRYESGYTFRDYSFYLASFVCILVSHLYKRKKVFYTIGFVFYFIVLYLSNLWGPYVFIYNKYISTLNEVKPPDFYWIFWQTYMIISSCIILYLLNIKINRNEIINSINLIIYTKLQNKSKQLLYTLIIIIPIWLFGFESETVRYMLVPLTTYFIVSLLFISHCKNKVSIIMGVVLSIAIFYYVIAWRFIFIKYILPIAFIIIIKNSINEKGFNSKYLFLFITGILSVIIYGIISEVNKLNISSLDYSLIGAVGKAFSSVDTIQYWCNRQIYRIITIWTILGGNIINYVHETGYVYGLSYIKFLAPYFNFEYISLPIISAKIIGASYAQPGVIAEGYANFGLMGACINALSIFFIAELFWDLLIRKKSVTLLIIYLVSFTQVILDGGSLNSIFFLSMLSIILYNLLFFLKRKEHKF